MLVYLATPAIWPGGWQLPVPDGAALVAAATGEPEPAATVSPGPEWDGQPGAALGGARRVGVPAGVPATPRTAPSGRAKWHGSALDRGAGQQPDLLRTAGFGVALTGAWT